jgi:LacI family transcriptional regulator
LNKPGAQATIYDVARHAGVSIKSVSRVLNDERVTPKLKAKVLEAMEALQYRSNLSARSLAGSRSFVIAILVDAALTTEHASDQHGNDYLTRLLLGALVATRHTGHHPLMKIVDTRAPDVRSEVLALLRMVRPDGVLLTPPSATEPAVLDTLEEAGVRYVRLGPQMDGRAAPKVDIDDFEAVRELTSELIRQGHTRLAHLEGDPRHIASHLRKDGFLAALNDHGLKAPSQWMFSGDFTYPTGVACGEAILKAADRPTAVVAGNDDMALGLMQTLIQGGIKVPQDLSVVGFDDSPIARLSVPPLTTIRQPVSEMAAAAMRLLIDASTSRADPEAWRDVRLDYELAIRGSTGPASTAEPAQRRRASLAE